MAGPYELQSPKDIAMEYGGNKQKIAQAAQMGLIDPTSAVMAGMFIDKMRMAQQEEMAPQSTVAQDVMAAPQMAAGLGATPQMAMAPQMIPTEAGVAALPVPDDMVPDEYAGGGIVAFSNGGKLSKEEIERRLREAQEGRGPNVSRPGAINRNPQGLDFIDTETDIVETYPSKNLRRPVGSSYTGPAKPPITSFSASKEPVFLDTTQPTEDPRIAEVMKNLELRRRILGEDVALKTEREGMKAAMDEQRAMRLLEAGLGIMGGESPYALQNIARGAAPAIKGYAEDRAAQRKRDLELAGMERAEKERALESVLKNEQAIRQAALSKDTDLRDTTRIYFEAAVARGANPNDPRTMESARRQAYADIGLARERLNVQEQGLTNAQIRAAMDSTAKALKEPGNRLEMLKRQEADRKNGTNTAEQFKDQIYQDELRKSMGGDAPAAPKAAPKKGTTGSKEKPLPMPKTAAEAEAGKVYMTARGPARWDGKQFVPVK